MRCNQPVVLQSQTLCVTAVTASNPTWCATTNPTARMDQTRRTAVRRIRFPWKLAPKHFVVNQKMYAQHRLVTLFPLKLIYPVYLGHVISTWWESSGRTCAISLRTLMTTLIGGLVVEARHQELDRLLTTALVNTGCKHFDSVITFKHLKSSQSKSNPEKHQYTKWSYATLGLPTAKNAQLMQIIKLKFRILVHFSNKSNLKTKNLAKNLS